MLETTFLTKFRAKLKKRYPDCFYYKIPDTKGLGGMRPFDAILILNGTTFVIEAKIDPNEKPTEYQEYNLNLAARNGAHKFVLCPENEVAFFGLLEARWNPQ